MTNRSQLVLSLLFLCSMVSNVSFATDGMIQFTGRIVEPTCVVQTGTLPTPQLNACSAQVALSTKVSSSVVVPASHMLVWRANDTVKPDLPVQHWKVIEVSYL